MIFQSSIMEEMRQDLLRIARSDCTVLITGETGTGKEAAAEFIHKNSARERGPFVPVNCSSIPEALLEAELFGFERGAFTGAALTRQGKLESARQGTVFLDEIGDMSLCAQPKILRAIEKKELYRLGGNRSIRIDVRFIAATNRELETLILEGAFREDLYYRLNVARVHMPPLRDRIEDIPPLANYFICQFNKQYNNMVDGLTKEALNVILRYGWPGNIRELRNVLEATFINLPSQRITLKDFPKYFLNRLESGRPIAQTEREELITALFSTSWNKSRTAEKLKWSRTKVYRKIKEHRIPPKTCNKEKRHSPSYSSPIRH